MERVGRARLAKQLFLHLVDRLGVEQVAELLLPEQFAQQVATSEEANGDAVGVSTATRSTRRAWRSARSVRSAGRSKTSCRHSRTVSSTTGKSG